MWTTCDGYTIGYTNLGRKEPNERFVVRIQKTAARWSNERSALERSRQIGGRELTSSRRTTPGGRDDEATGPSRPRSLFGGSVRGKGEGAIFKDSRGLWTAVVELPPRDGKRRRKTIRSKDKRTVIDKLADLQRELKIRGDLPTADQTVEQWLSYWLAEVVAKENRPKTVSGYRSVVNQHIVKEIGHVRLEKLTPAHVRHVVKRITDHGLSSTYALNAHRVMSSAFEVALREGRIGRNPAKLTSAPRKAVAPQEAFTLQEALVVLDHVSRDPEMGARWATGLMTAGRRGEVIGLERDRVGDVIDFSWQLQRLKLTASGKPDAPADYEYRHLSGGLYLTRPKSDAGWRVFPAFEPLRSILEQHISSTPDNEWGLVFTRRDRPVDPDQDTRAWREVLAATGVERDVVLHGLRHTTIDLLYLAGVDEDIIRQIVGHSTREMTRGYKSRANTERLMGSMDGFAALFVSLQAGSSGTRLELDA
jgi:integrase